MIPRKINNQYTAVYRTTDDIDNFHLRITLKKLYSIIQIPKYEASSSSTDQQSATTDFVETIELKWQEKIFSKTEFNYYSQKENCKSEIEKRYHQMIKEAPDNYECGTMFTYIADDKYEPNDNFGHELKMTKLRNNVDQRHEKNENSNETEAFRYTNDSNEFVKMFIMADLDQTVLLFAIQYRKSDGLFIIYPDFNEADNSYYLEIDQNSKQMYTYYMENYSATSDEMTKKLKQKQKLSEVQDETCEMIKKMGLLSIKDQNFYSPKFCRIVLMLEIMSGENFENDNVYVQFKFKLPKFVKVIEGLIQGSTHSSYRNENSFNFGYIHHLVLDIDDEFLISQSELETICINFDVISIDSLWQRHRREGVTSIKIPLEKSKSIDEVDLACYRELQGNSWLIDFLERFFLGGLSNIKFNDHNQQNVHNFYGNSTVTTGFLKIKIHQIRQIQNSYRSSNSRMQSVNEIIERYHQAKAKLK